MLAASIFKANDIRGIVLGEGTEFDEEGAERLGAAFVELTGATEFLLGRDCRYKGQELSQAFARGARKAGSTVTWLGMTSTDQVWFGSGHRGIPGVQFTASHNPANYNGVKFCLANAKPVSEGFTQALREKAGQVDLDRPVAGAERSWDCLSDYVAKLHELVPLRPGRRLKVVADAGNGMAGLTVEATLQGRNVDLIGLYLDPDPAFPNHPANPLNPENLIDAQQAVRSHGADLGLVFDGDADRCFIIDETGAVIDPSVVTAMIAVAELERVPGSTIVVNSITSQCVADAVFRKGKIARSLVGHTFVKALMAKEDAVFGGEHSAHFYFRDFWSADTGMLAALHMVEMAREGALSEIAQNFDRYSRSGEINLTVADISEALDKVSRHFAGRGEVDRADGLTLRDLQAGWWLNLRPSNTEPWLRLNVEARDPQTMAELRDQVLAIVRVEGN